MVRADVPGQCGHLDRQHAFGDQFSRAGADDSHAQHALGLRIEDQLRHAFGAIDRHGAAGGGPGKLRDLDFAVLFLRLRFGQPAPGNFGIGEHDCGNGVGLERDFVSGDGFDRGASFVRGLVRQHRFADHIADGVDGGIVGLQLLVHLNESALVRLCTCVLSRPGISEFGLRPTETRTLVEDLFALLDVGAVEGDADAVRLRPSATATVVFSRMASNIFSRRLCRGRTRSRSAPGSKPGQHFDHGHFRAQRRIDRAQFQADVAAADHQQRSGNVVQDSSAPVESIMRGRVELEAGNDRRTRTGREDDAIEGQDSLRRRPALETRSVFEFSKAARPWMY